MAMWTPSLRMLVASVANRSDDRDKDERVSLAVGLSRVREGRCYQCGAVVEPALLELGSPRCLDCGGTHGNEKGFR